MFFSCKVMAVSVQMCHLSYAVLTDSTGSLKFTPNA